MAPRKVFTNKITQRKLVEAVLDIQAHKANSEAGKKNQAELTRVGVTGLSKQVASAAIRITMRAWD
ncbi:hypothetical protein N7517_006130 [Penicillium concentricum]|uniref:Uncharacterized protein n=1 Tax=Penicillium concentricum TaxID=293559 RepID=A0A9W9VB16_9EURO|nr:uncharacterized protein N7517_006130 [Penicillium concentricum]KAJ5374124.1 hypothetical protein N7517_006130 [Penicillium concentricum]